MLYRSWLLLLFISISSIQLTSTTRSAQTTSPLQPTRSNFLRTAVLGSSGRRPWCGADPKICIDRDKNPWGGETCCLGRHCVDTNRDPDHCGVCGHKCSYGLLCCGGTCVDIRVDPKHCGTCYNRCGEGIPCDFGMCDYGGGI
ncbi:hypothetical protein LUZ60_015862 [Juncus effusus]|nr:hypothetical protein LUZ60_015862 [Juncus effusus]